MQPSPQLAAPSPASRDTAAAATDAPAQPTPKAPPHTLDREGIRGAIREKLPEMQDCYEAWLQQNPELGGTVALSFQVIAADGGGVVQNITIVDGGVGHRAFEGCVGNVFNDLDFEEPLGGTMNVTYPVMFSNNPPP